MPAPGTARLTTQRETYLGYSVGCVAVWGLILAAARRCLDPQSWQTLRLCCGAWWSGWTSATIARAGLPPPQPLTPERKERLARVSLVLVAMGLIGVIRMLLAGKLPDAPAAGGSGAKAAV